MRKSFGKRFTIPLVEMLQLTKRINYDWIFKPRIEKKYDELDPDATDPHKKEWWKKWENY